jgi:hypothetical protein
MISCNKIYKINTDTLDNQLKVNNIDNIDFINIDIQGTEPKILRGATDSLKNVIGLEVEVVFLKSQENQPLFCDIDNLVRNNGFEFLDFRRGYSGPHK